MNHSGLCKKTSVQRAAAVERGGAVEIEAARTHEDCGQPNPAEGENGGENAQCVENIAAEHVAHGDVGMPTQRGHE